MVYHHHSHFFFSCSLHHFQIWESSSTNKLVITIVVGAPYPNLLGFTTVIALELAPHPDIVLLVLQLNALLAAISGL